MKQISKSIVGALLGASALWGCANDVGGANGELRYVDTQDMQGEQLYFVEGLSQLPLTSVQVATLGDQAHSATPVRVAIYNDVAVAWRAPNGVAVLGRNNIVALWSVVDATPVRDEVAPGSIWTVNNPGTVASSIRTGGVSTGLINVPTVQPGALQSAAQIALVDFFNRIGSPDEALLIQRLNAAHPGCI